MRWGRHTLLSRIEARLQQLRRPYSGRKSQQTLRLVRQVETRKVVTLNSPILYRTTMFAITVALCCSPGWMSAQSIPAFPGAEGHGAESVGGRGGRIIEVTNLNDHGPGSLREAVETRGPRTIVFRVAGYIDLETPIKIVHPYMTIAGQTAPGGGICLRMKPGNKTGLSPVLGTKRFKKNYAGEVPHNLIIRYIRIRHGRSPTSKKAGGPRPKNLQFYSGNNIIVDHVTSGWTNDNLVTIIAPNNGSPHVHDITVQRSLLAESFKGHATGLNVQGQTGAYWKQIYRISVHHNLFAHNTHRNPRSTSGGTEVINNVTYNWRHWIGSTTRGAVVDWVNNYWKQGPMRDSYYEHYLSHEDAEYPGAEKDYPWNPSIYIAGNVLEHALQNPKADNWPLFVMPYKDDRALPRRYQRTSRLPAPTHPVTVQTAAKAYRSVLADVGANARLRRNGRMVKNQDSIDKRVLKEVARGKGPSAVIFDENQLGGFPKIDPGTLYRDIDHDGMADEWETKHFGNLRRGNPNNSSADYDRDGYTDVEEFLNGTNPKRKQ